MLEVVAGMDEEVFTGMEEEVVNANASRDMFEESVNAIGSHKLELALPLKLLWRSRSRRQVSMNKYTFEQVHSHITPLRG